MYFSVLHGWMDVFFGRTTYLLTHLYVYNNLDTGNEFCLLSDGYQFMAVIEKIIFSLIAVFKVMIIFVHIFI